MRFRRGRGLGDATVTGVRPAIGYEHGHLPGAVNVTVGDLAAGVEERPAGKRSVACCLGGAPGRTRPTEARHR